MGQEGAFALVPYEGESWMSLYWRFSAMYALLRMVHKSLLEMSVEYGEKKKTIYELQVICCSHASTSRSDETKATYRNYRKDVFIPFVRTLFSKLLALSKKACSAFGDDDMDAQLKSMMVLKMVRFYAESIDR